MIVKLLGAAGGAFAGRMAADKLFSKPPTVVANPGTKTAGMVIGAIVGWIVASKVL